MDPVGADWMKLSYFRTYGQVVDRLETLDEELGLELEINYQTVSLEEVSESVYGGFIKRILTSKLSHLSGVIAEMKSDLDTEIVLPEGDHSTILVQLLFHLIDRFGKKDADFQAYNVVSVQKLNNIKASHSSSASTSSSPSTAAEAEAAVHQEALTKGVIKRMGRGISTGETTCYAITSEAVLRLVQDSSNDNKNVLSQIICNARRKAEKDNTCGMESIGIFHDDVKVPKHSTVGNQGHSEGAIGRKQVGNFFRNFFDFWQSLAHKLISDHAYLGFVNEGGRNPLLMGTGSDSTSMVSDLPTPVTAPVAGPSSGKSSSKSRSKSKSVANPKKTKSSTSTSSTSASSISANSGSNVPPMNRPESKSNLQSKQQQHQALPEIAEKALELFNEGKVKIGETDVNAIWISIGSESQEHFSGDLETFQKYMRTYTRASAGASPRFTPLYLMCRFVRDENETSKKALLKALETVKSFKVEHAVAAVMGIPFVGKNQGGMGEKFDETLKMMEDTWAEVGIGFKAQS